jgi:hypothetical protein
MDLATAVILQPGEYRSQVDIKIASAPFFCVDGKIHPSRDFAIQEAGLVGAVSARVRSSSGSEGTYHVCGLAPGQYRLSTENASTEFSVLGSDLQHVDLSADPVQLRL